MCSRKNRNKQKVYLSVPEYAESKGWEQEHYRPPGDVAIIN